MELLREGVDHRHARRLGELLEYEQKRTELDLRVGVGFDGRIIGMTTFGESAPGGALLEHFGFTVDNIVSTVEELLED